VIIKSDVFRAVKKLPQQYFDIIFLDPPYQKNLLNRAIISILDLLTKSGIIVVEHHKREAMIVPSGYYLFKEKRYGDSLVGFLKRL
ncbi:MAG: RsmD family RNA methyltransferase, partial [candidate division WOR-3 bacterium]